MPISAIHGIVIQARVLASEGAQMRAVVVTGINAHIVIISVVIAIFHGRRSSERRTSRHQT